MIRDGNLAMANELTDEAKAEIAAAVKIVAEDKNSARLRAIHAHLIPETPENTPPEDGDPTPPPAKETPSEPVTEPRKGKGLWWDSERLGGDE